MTKILTTRAHHHTGSNTDPLTIFCAWVLGVLGLIPFIFGAMSVAVWSNGSWETTTYVYAAIILSFLGGIHWPMSLLAQNALPRILVAMIPSITAWLAITIAPQAYTAWILSGGLLLMFVYDLAHESFFPSYKILRATLTTVAIISLFAIHVARY